MRLDHLVINTRFATDAAAILFESLGFTLTPRGYHSLGSINHLMMFDDHYLELIGLPQGTTKLRDEILASATGIDGLVLRTDDAAGTRAQLIERGFKPQPVQLLTRPVHVEGSEYLARFNTVRLPGDFAAGRVYYCQQLTPELIWRDEWLRHPNGVRGIAALYVIDEDASQSADRYDALVQDPITPSHRFALHQLSRRDFDAHFGKQASWAPQRKPCFGAISLRCNAVDRIAHRAEAAGLPTLRLPDRLVIALPAFETLLEFIE